MSDLHAGDSAEVRAEKKAALASRRAKLAGEAGTRGKHEDLDALKAKNAAALAARKKSQPLPEGWTCVESRSKPGEFVYENNFTEERQAWLPSEPAYNPNAGKTAMVNGVVTDAEALKEKNRKALAARKASMGQTGAASAFLPEGWKQVESRSRPGEYVYENIYTEERISWLPTEKAQQKAMPEMTVEPPADTSMQYKVLYAYSAMTAEELDLQPDDIINVEVKTDSGWWVGVNCRTGQMGLFPDSFVQECIR